LRWEASILIFGPLLHIVTSMALSFIKFCIYICIFTCFFILCRVFWCAFGRLIVCLTICEIGLVNGLKFFCNMNFDMWDMEWHGTQWTQLET
jgi:hypothetical protein